MLFIFSTLVVVIYTKMYEKVAIIFASLHNFHQIIDLSISYRRQVDSLNPPKVSMKRIVVCRNGPKRQSYIHCVTWGWQRNININNFILYCWFLSLWKDVSPIRHIAALVFGEIYVRHCLGQEEQGSREDVLKGLFIKVKSNLWSVDILLMLVMKM